MRSRPRALCFLRRFRVCFAAAVALAAATTLPAPSCARTLQTRDLAGWWIAVDEMFPTLWRRGTIVVMEELLIVTPDGRAENRSMTFEAPSPASCAGHGLCTDAPLIATARLALKSGLLTVSERKETTNRISFSAADPQLRRIAITATPAWTVTAVDGLLILRSATSSATRALARIAPERLRALRAGMFISGRSASEHWRCFLANATARNPAFAPLHGSRHEAPAFLEAYLRAASYGLALLAAWSTPTPDDPDPKVQALKRDDVEYLMAAAFADIVRPGTATESRQLFARLRYLRLRARGLDPEAAARHEDVASLSRGEPVKLAISDAELAAFGRVVAATEKPEASADADVKRLFCLD